MANEKRGRAWLVSGLVAIAAVGAAAYLMLGADEARPGYLFATAERGPIASVVSASGTLRAVVTVEVGSQISGQIKELTADFNTAVRAGETIARIDPEQFEANVAQAGAELAVARANVAMQRATLSELQAEIEGAAAALAEARADLKRKQALLERKVASKSDVDKAVAANDQAKAQVKAAQAKLRKQAAQIDLALAQVQQKMAALQQRQIDLDRTIIRSPVDGVVISRDVDIGQTVAASLQAPVLFTIAQDLSSMQVEVSVDEADIGQILGAQRATFSVDSYPNRQFEGRIKQIRKAPVEISNVVTYTVVVAAENADLRLLPGMTANVSIIVGERAGALKIPNRALRFRPAGIDGVAAESGGRASGARHPAGERRQNNQVHLASDNRPQRGRVWVLGADGKPKPVDVRYGISDGTVSEIVRGELAEGTKVIVGVAREPSEGRRRILRFGF